MSLPTPNFLSGDQFAAWWWVSAGGVTNACMSTGATIVRRARRAVGLSDTRDFDSQLAQALSTASGRQLPTPRDVMQAAVWAAVYRQAGYRLDAVQIPDSAFLPAIGQQVGDDGGSGQMMCLDPNSDPNPWQLTERELQTAVQQSSTGIRVAPGRPTPRTDVSVDFSSVGATVGTVGVAVAGVALALGVWLVVKGLSERK